MCKHIKMNLSSFLSDEQQANEALNLLQMN